MDPNPKMLPPTDRDAGETLATRLEREQRLPLPEILRIGREIALQLAVVHERGPLPRPLESASIWLERSTGHARLAGDPTPAPTSPTPEQPPANRDEGADLHALAVVLYQMCTGETPAETPIEPFWLNDKITASLSNLIMQMLSTNPGERPQSARDVADTLAAIEGETPTDPPDRLFAGAGDTPSRSRSSTADSMVDSMVDSMAESMEPTSVAGRLTMPSWTRRRWRWLAIGVVAIAAVAALALWRTPSQPVVDDRPAVAMTPYDFLTPKMLTPLQQRYAGGGHADQAPAELVDLLGDGRYLNPGDHDRWSALAVNANGSRFATSHGDSAVRIFDAETGELLRHCPMPSPVTSLTFAPNGRTLYAIREGGRMIALDPETATAVPHKFQHPGITAIEFSRDGAIALTAGANGRHRVWNVRDGKELFVLDAPCTLHPDGKQILYADGNVLHLWDIGRNEYFDRLDYRDAGGLPKEPCTFRFSPDGKWLFLGYAKSTIVYGFDRRNFNHTDREGSLGARIEFSGDSRFAVTTTANHVVNLWDVQTGEVKTRIPSTGIHRAVFVPGQFKVAVLDRTDRIRFANFQGEYDREPDPRPSLVWLAANDTGIFTYSKSDVNFRNWILATRTSRGLIQGLIDTSVEIDPAATKLLWGSGELAIELDLRTLGTTHHTTKHAAVRSTSFAASPNGRWLALGSADGLTLWDLGLQKSTVYPRSASFLALTNEVLIAADHAAVHAVRPVVATELTTNRRLWSHDLAPDDLRVSRDGALAALAQSGDRQTLVLDVATGFTHAKLPPALRVAFSPDSQKVATVSGAHLSVFTARTGERLAHIPLGIDKSVAAVSFAPDNRHIVLGYSSGVIAIFRLESH